MINHNIIKLAEIQLATDTDDVVKVAGVLSSIKNWLTSFFDPGRAGRAAQILEKSLKIKPLLEDVHDILNNIEKNIYNADIHSYDDNIEKLKGAVAQLNAELNKVQEAIKEKPVSENTPAPAANINQAAPPIIQTQEEKKKNIPWRNLPRASTLPENYSFYKIGKPLNFYNITRENIKEPSEWNVRFNRSSSLKAAWSESITDLEKDLTEIQDVTSKDFIQQQIYQKIPTWIIKDIKPRTLDQHGNPKAGMAELLVAGKVIVPVPSGKKWELYMEFVLVDHSNYDIDNMNIQFNIWSQYVKKITQVV